MKNLAILFLLLVACNGSGPTEPNDPFVRQAQISGTVRDYGSNAGVAGAKVRLGATEVIANEQGRYAVTVQGNLYPVTVNDVQIGQISARSSRNEVDLLVNGGSCRTRYGTIVDAQTGSPIAGAEIVLAGVHAQSLAAGSYRIDLGCDANNGSGTGFMTVTRGGYKTATLAYRYENLAPPQRHDVELTRN
jgi:hypothetical protein